jgi:hypothetical protein
MYLSRRNRKRYEGGILKRGLTKLILIGAVGTVTFTTPALAVTIGQVADPAGSTCAENYDWAQPSVTSGTPYVAPGNGTITSWTTYGGAVGGKQVTMKMWRPLPAQPSFLLAVGHSGPFTVASGGVAGNTFPANVVVRKGDILGLHTGTPSTPCTFSSPGDSTLASVPENAGDGQVGGPFGPSPNARLNIRAEFTYDDQIGLSKLKRNKKTGAGRLTLELPNAGQLSAAGAGAKVSVVGGSGVSAGKTDLIIKAKGKSRARLDRTGLAKLRLMLRYQPSGGELRTQHINVKLRKNI